MKVYGHLGEGSVSGVIAKYLEPGEVSGETIGEVLVADVNIRDRMAAEADAFIGLPGDVYTLEVTSLVGSRLSTKALAVSCSISFCLRAFG